MSKMSTLNLELQEQANELGFSTVQEALDAGYEVDYENETLKDSQTAAHEAWLKEKEEVLKCLARIVEYDSHEEARAHAKRAIEFIKGGEV